MMPRGSSSALLQKLAVRGSSEIGRFTWNGVLVEKRGKRELRRR